MSIFIERFLLTVLAGLLLTGILLNNPIKFDGIQRVSLGIAIVALAVFSSRTVERIKSTPQDQQHAPSTPISPPPQATGSATTSGPDSPAITGHDNQVQYAQPQKQAKPEKGKR